MGTDAPARASAPPRRLPGDRDTTSGDSDVDHGSFDRLARLLGEATDRRAGLKAALAAVLGGGAAVAALTADAEARRKGRDGNASGPGAEKRGKKRKTCKPAGGSGYDCVKVGKTRECVCATEVVCGDVCCRIG